MMDIPVNDKDPGTDSSGVAKGPGLPLLARSQAQDGKGPLCPHAPSGLSLTLQPDWHKPVQPVLLLGVFGCYGYIVEHAESVGSSPLAVVPRRPGGERGAGRVIVPSQGPRRSGVGDHAHLTRASPLRTAPISTASTSCSAAPAASRAQWKVLCGGKGLGQPPAPHPSQALPRPVPGYRAPSSEQNWPGQSRVPAVAANRAQHTGAWATNRHKYRMCNWMGGLARARTGWR